MEKSKEQPTEHDNISMINTVTLWKNEFQEHFEATQKKLELKT